MGGNLLYAQKRKIKSYAVSVLFILPSFLVISYLVFYPIFNTLYVSFFRWNGTSPTMEFVGLGNYMSVFSDPRFHRSMSNNFIWMVMHLIFACFYGLVVAVIISKIPKGKLFFRTALFLPNVISLAVSGIMWMMIYNPRFGIVVTTMKALGLNTSGVSFTHPSTAIYFLAIASSWQGYGYYMVLFLAGLQNVDISMYEAADIDGAGPLQKFWYITIPGLRNVFTFVVSIALINGLRGFATVWVMTEGGPGYSTFLVTVYGFVKAFRETAMGEAMVSGITIGVIIIAITLIFNIIREKMIEV